NRRTVATSRRMSESSSGMPHSMQSGLARWNRRRCPSRPVPPRLPEFAQRLSLNRGESSDSGGRQIELTIEQLPRVSLPLGGSLHLDKLAAAVHHDVAIDLGGAVFAIVEVEDGFTIYDTHA